MNTKHTPELLEALTEHQRLLEDVVRFYKQIAEGLDITQSHRRACHMEANLRYAKAIERARATITKATQP